MQVINLCCFNNSLNRRREESGADRICRRHIVAACDCDSKNKARRSDQTQIAPLECLWQWKRRTEQPSAVAAEAAPSRPNNSVIGFFGRDVSKHSCNTYTNLLNFLKRRGKKLQQKLLSGQTEASTCRKKRRGTWPEAAMIDHSDLKALLSCATDS